MRVSEIEAAIQKHDVKELALQFTDLSGILHSLWVPAGQVSKVAEEGIHMDGSSVDMVDISESDLKLMPDLDTFAVMPAGIFPRRVARVVCNIFEPDSDRPLAIDPRFLLKRVVKDSSKTLGDSVTYNACSEIEYFLFGRDGSGSLRRLDEGGYLASPPADSGVDTRLEITENLRSVGVVVEKHHHEVPPGKYELNIPYSNALKMADTVYMVKMIVKMTAERKGLVASFMPKPFHDGYGAGLHTHVSLTDDRRKRNLFYDQKGPYGITRTALSFIAGVLAHARGIAALTNPSVNSYKRLVPGWEAPVYLSWAKYNRSVLVRVPPGKGMKARIEYRPTDGSCNFYVAYAAILAAGLDGVRRKLDPPEPVEEDIYHMDEKARAKRGIGTLPGSLGEALVELAGDRYMRDSLGSAFCDKFLKLKGKEWNEFNRTVHEWERKKYLDV
ncbi:MAG TPA: glutamine synthetase family protein [Nitrososphaerales archaeon]|nr:glutamine synthetase family protein [Nitrososphaerales archaeon]